MDDVDRGSAAQTARRSILDPLHIVDVFVYVVVLNLVTQFVPEVITESFLVSLLTAVLLKLVLESVLHAKKWVLGRIRSAETLRGLIVTVGMLVLLLPAGKLLVLWLEDLVFGDAVELGGFWSVTALVVALSVSRWGVRRLLGSRGA